MALAGTDPSKPVVSRELVRNLDRISDKVDAAVGTTEIGPGERLQAHQALLELASTSPYSYWVIMKLIKDRAKLYLSQMGMVNIGMSDSQIARHVCINSGAWQALTQLAMDLEPESLRKNLESLMGTRSTIMEAGAITR